ncbi:MAG: MerR family transcriptional regulator [Lachnospiraceae bacterium]|nr:MerR family transcriptional regulator [Lachnospiraceae bacterium]
MKKKYLTVSELARLRNTTAETLRYYDRINLLKPEYVSEETGYRYYSIRQYEKLGTILELRSLKMPLEQIVEYFHNRNLKKSAELLQEYQKKLEDDIRHYMELNEILKEKVDFIQSLDHLELNRVEVQDISDRYMISFGEQAGGREAHAYAYTKLEGCLNDEVAPILASDRVGVYSDERLLEKSDAYIPSYPMLLVKENTDNPHIQKIPGGKYACMHYANGTLERYDSSFEIIKKYLTDHNLKINGNILQLYKLDVTLTNDREETIMEIQIPVIEA